MKVRIPTPLHSYTRNRSVVDAQGSTLEDVTRDLDRQFPGIRFRFVDEQDRLRPHVKVFLNQTQALALSTAVGADDEVVIVQAFSGG
jgi:molybdopterin synthase sulfur carrier subunit